MASQFRNIIAIVVGLACGAGCSHIPQMSPLFKSDRIPQAKSQSATSFAELHKDALARSDTTSAAARENTRTPSGVVRVGGAVSGDERDLSGPNFVPLDSEFIDGPTPSSSDGGYPRPIYRSTPFGDRADSGSGSPNSAPSGNSSGPSLHQRSTPTTKGKLYELDPPERLVDRAVLMAQAFERTQAEVKRLRERVATLEQQLALSDRTSADERHELEQAASELASAKTHMESLNEEVLTLRERLRRLDRQELDTLRELTTALEKLLQDGGSRKSGW